jgi:hypothetical protein
MLLGAYCLSGELIEGQPTNYNYGHRVLTSIQRGCYGFVHGKEKKWSSTLTEVKAFGARALP